MSDIEAVCPRCGREYWVDEADIGLVAQCEACGTEFEVKRSQTEPAHAAAASSPEGTQPAQPTASQVLGESPDVTVPVADAERTIPASAPATEQSLPATPAAKLAIGPTEEAAVAPVWTVGDVILDTYEVKHVHEGGGMGLVYRVYHRNWNMDLAVKSPRPDYFQTEEQKENFKHECEAWIELGLHPNIVSCYYVRTLGGIPRVFAEYVEGGSLKDWIESKKLYEGGPQEALRRILDIAIQFAWGLHYAHEKGLIHRDVKPANVVMTPEGEAKVTDFGLANARAAAGERVVPGGERSILVSTGGMTPAYCSPEQACGEKLSRKTDIWSWAVSVLEMFVGEVCWQSGVAAPKVLEQLQGMQAEGVALPEMPKQLRLLLLRCFEAEPERRPNLAEVVFALHAAYQQTTGQTYPRQEPKATEVLADGLNNRAVSMIELGAADDAEKTLEQAMAVDPQHLESVYNHAVLRWRLGRDDDLSACARVAKCKHADRHKGALYLGRMQMERCMADQAEAELRVALEDPTLSSDSQHWALLGSALMAQGKFNDAEMAYERALSLPSPDRLSNVHVAQARLHSRTSKGRLLFPWNHELKRFEGYGAINSFQFSPTGEWFLVGTRVGLLKVSTDDLTVVRKQAFNRPMQEGVSVLAISQDGRLAFMKVDAAYELWDLATFKTIWSRQRPDMIVPTSVIVAPNFAFALAGWHAHPNASKLDLWDMASGNDIRCLGVIKGLPITITHDSRTALFSGLEYGEEMYPMRLVDLGSGNTVRPLKGCTRYRGLLSSDASFLVTGYPELSNPRNQKAALEVWDMETGICQQTFQGSNYPLALSSDDQLLLAGAISGSVRSELQCWDIRRGRCICHIGAENNSSHGGTRHVEISPDGSKCVVAYPGSSALGFCVMEIGLCPIKGAAEHYAVIRPRGSKEISDVRTRFSNALSNASSAIERKLFAGAWDSLSQARSIPGFQRHPEALKLCGSLALNGTKKALRDLWEGRQLAGHDAAITAVALGRDGRIAVSGDVNGQIRTWDVRTGVCLSPFPGQPSSIVAVHLLPDEEQFLSVSGMPPHAASSQNGQLALWEVRTGNCRSKIDLDFCPTGAAFRPGLNLALIGCEDRSLRVLDLATGECRRVLKGHDGPVLPAISTDGRLGLASGFGKILLWDLRSGGCVRTFAAHSYNTRACMSPDGLGFVSVGLDETSRIWKLQDEKPVRELGWMVSAVYISNERWIASVSKQELQVLDLFGKQANVVAHGSFGGRTLVTVSDDGGWLGIADGPLLRVWQLDWDVEFPQPADWNDAASPYTTSFLTLHCPIGEDGITRVGKPVWNEANFQELVLELQCRGYGWLRPDGVREKLEEMTANWKGPPPLPWEQGDQA